MPDCWLSKGMSGGMFVRTCPISVSFPVESSSSDFFKVYIYIYMSISIRLEIVPCSEFCPRSPRLTEKKKRRKLSSTEKFAET